MDLSRDELRRLARLGAERRIEELRREEAALRAAFPELGGAGRRRGRPSVRATSVASAAATGAKRRRRKSMTAAQKRAVSERMKKYWAARRKAEG
jgi:hypothetical protein